MSEELVARINTPQLHGLSITYLNQLDFQVPQPFKFVDRSDPELLQLWHAKASFDDRDVFNICHEFDVLQSAVGTFISCRGIDWQVSHMIQVLSQTSAMLSNVVHLLIQVYDLQPSWQDNTDEIKWLELLCRFTAVRTLGVCEELAGHNALVLEGVTGR